MGTFLHPFVLLNSPFFQDVPVLGIVEINKLLWALVETTYILPSALCLLPYGRKGATHTPSFYKSAVSTVLGSLYANFSFLWALLSVFFGFVCFFNFVLECESSEHLLFLFMFCFLLYRSICLQCGECQRALAREELQCELDIESEVLTPLQNIAEVCQLHKHHLFLITVNSIYNPAFGTWGIGGP